MDDVKGWDGSAKAWVTSVGDNGDWSRRVILDKVMLERSKSLGGRFLDIGCGEGRFCRLLSENNMRGVGVDPVAHFINTAETLDHYNEYQIGCGEELAFDDFSFDLTISYLALIDIEDFRKAIAEMVRVTKSGGCLLIANLNGFFTAGKWQFVNDRKPDHFRLDRYNDEWPSREQWAGIDIINWHRPLSAYFEAFLSHGLILKYFSEPTPQENVSDKHDRYTRVPAFVIMEWQKP